jgi:alanine dehydrogenase
MSIPISAIAVFDSKKIKGVVRFTEDFKTDSVIIDVCIDQGGCFETSEMTTLDPPIFRK